MFFVGFGYHSGGIFSTNIALTKYMLDLALRIFCACCLRIQRRNLTDLGSDVCLCLSFFLSSLFFVQLRCSSVLAFCTTFSSFLSSSSNLGICHDPLVLQAASRPREAHTSSVPPLSQDAPSQKVQVVLSRRARSSPLQEVPVALDRREGVHGVILFLFLDLDLDLFHHFRSRLRLSVACCGVSRGISVPPE